MASHYIKGVYQKRESKLFFPPLNTFSHCFFLFVQKIVARMSSDNRVSFGDFAKYVVEHEKRLEDIFRQLDKNMDGQSGQDHAYFN